MKFNPLLLGTTAVSAALLGGCVSGGGGIFSEFGAGEETAAPVAATAVGQYMGKVEYIPGCTVAPGESWTKCQVTADGQPVPPPPVAAPGAQPEIPQAGASPAPPGTIDGVIPGCTVAPGEYWTKCQTTAGQPAPPPAIAPPEAEVPEAPTEFDIKDTMPHNFANIPGLQEVHAVMSKKHCLDLLSKLRREGNVFHGGAWYPQPMPGARQFGQCKLIGPSAKADRFADTRYEKDP
jgi:hypothetical protein